MRLIISVVVIALCSTLGGSLCSAQSGPAPAAQAYITKNDMPGFQSALSLWLDNALAKAGRADAMAELPNSTAYRLALAQHEFLHATGATNLSALCADPAGQAFMQIFLGSTGWLELWLASGPVPTNTAEGITCLKDIYTADRSDNRAKYLTLATAVALVFSTEPTKRLMDRLVYQVVNPVTPFSRYSFYKKADEADKLYPVFKKLKPWELRWVVSAWYDDKSLEWALENVNVPLWKYPESCWFCQYSGCSFYGDTVQGALFYMPWNNLHSRMENIYIHGGVCGSLSTFGAIAAMAHGIPAYTVGQPGHCAYAVRMDRKKWVGGFGGPAGGPVYHFWTRSYYDILLMEDVFYDDISYLNSQRHVWQANLYKNRDKARAYAAYGLALQKSPINYSAWDELINTQLSDPALPQTQWKKTAEALMARMARHPRPMLELFKKFEKDKILAGMKDAEKLQWFAAIHRTIENGKGEATWDFGMDRIFGEEAKAFPKDSESGWSLYKTALGIHATNELFLGQLLEWGTKNLESDKGANADKVIKALAEAVGENQSRMNEKTVKKTLGTAITASETAKSMDAFQAASDAAAKFWEKQGDVKLERPEGLKLISGDGLFYASSTAYDNPVLHRDVLRERGGYFHTDREKAPFAVVQLRRTSRLSGILIVNRNSNQGRAKPLKVYTSTDGATWNPIWETSEVKQQWWIPLSGKDVTARWIKVESPHEEPEHLHLRNICVYGEPTA